MPELLAADRSLSLSVQIRGVVREFEGKVVALNGIDLDVAPGEFLAILGPSGCGKSTLLRLIAGLDRPQSGSVRIGAGTPPDHAGSDIAYVFQDAHLLPWRTVAANVELPLELAKVKCDERQARSLAALARVGLGDLAGRYPNQLSGGQRMRVSLARALVTQPRLLLLDEPFAALDEITRQRLDEELHGLWRTLKMTVIFVTHSTQEATFLATRAIVMSARPGRIIEDMPIELPASRGGALRGEPGFAAIMRGLFQSLERGGA